MPFCGEGLEGLGLACWHYVSTVVGGQEWQACAMHMYVGNAHVGYPAPDAHGWLLVAGRPTCGALPSAPTSA